MHESAQAAQKGGIIVPTAPIEATLQEEIIQTILGAEETILEPYWHSLLTRQYPTCGK